MALELDLRPEILTDGSLVACTAVRSLLRVRTPFYNVEMVSLERDS